MSLLPHYGIQTTILAIVGLWGNMVDIFSRLNLKFSSKTQCSFIISLNLFQIVVVSAWKLLVCFFKKYFLYLFCFLEIYLFLVFTCNPKRITSVWSLKLFHWDQWSVTFHIKGFTCKQMQLFSWTNRTCLSGNTTLCLL